MHDRINEAIFALYYTVNCVALYSKFRKECGIRVFQDQISGNITCNTSRSWCGYIYMMISHLLLPLQVLLLPSPADCFLCATTRPESAKCDTTWHKISPCDNHIKPHDIKCHQVTPNDTTGLLISQNDTTWHHMSELLPYMLNPPCDTTNY